VGIIGRTGAGKSTIFNLLLKIVNPQQGDILIDGVSYLGIPAKDIRNSITIIDQEPVIIASNFR
jgi:ABC-type multidrug transport system fused ATPase/permease subunit